MDFCPYSHYCDELTGLYSYMHYCMPKSSIGKYKGENIKLTNIHRTDDNSELVLFDIITAHSKGSNYEMGGMDRLLHKHF